MTKLGAAPKLTYMYLILAADLEYRLLEVVLHVFTLPNIGPVDTFRCTQKLWYWNFQKGDKVSPAC
jgi:hypothetical protein